MSLVVLRGAEVSHYLGELRAAVEVARLSALYYPPAPLLETLSWLEPDNCIDDTLKLDARTGLPSLRELLRPTTDRAAAPAELERPAAPDDRTSAGKHLEKKRRYYRRLVNAPLPPLEQVQVTVRREDARGRKVRVILDKLEARGGLCRLTVLCGERSAVAPPEEVAEAVQKAGAFDAELAFVHLCDRLGLEVENVSRGVVGPLWRHDVRQPEEVQPLLAAGGFILSCSSEQVGIDVPASGSNDPFAALYEEELSGDAKQTLHAVQDRLGYRVYRDRKLVVSAGLTAKVAALCEARGKRCVIYEVS